jgi:hypothetical protein
MKSKAVKSIASFTMVMAMVAPMAITPGSAQAAPKLSKSSISITTGKSATIKLKGAKKGSWSTSNSKIATVSAKGKKATIKGVGAGNATITCKVKKKSLTVKVKVRQMVSSFVIQNSSSNTITSLDIKPSDKIKVKGAINGNKSGSTTNQSMKWTSSDSKVAKVKKTGTNGATITGISNGTATISVTVAANGSDKKTATLSVKVAGSSSSSTTTTTKTDTKNDTKATATPKATAKPTEKPVDKNVYPAGYVYKQRNTTSEGVQRWYKPGDYKGHKHDGYSTNSFAIWMIGFFDNEYSSNEDGKGEVNEGIYGPTLDDYKGKTLSMGGEFWYEGDDQETVLLQINYTSPDDYPMMVRWQKGSKGAPNQEAEGLKIKKDEYGKDAVKANSHEKFTISGFTIPANAANGDKDDNGKAYGIYVYFPNKPGGSLIYNKSNTFHFKDFWIKKPS